MDMEEFHDFVIEANLITDKYGFDTMVGQFTKANAGSNDDVLELHELGADVYFSVISIWHRQKKPQQSQSG